jgi:23S rRNA (pseudouridine1915-N3)-methyltransferase
MKIRIITVGKIKERYLQEGIAEYERRLRPYTKIQIVELSEETRHISASSAIEPVAKVKEGKRILAAIPEGSFVIALEVKAQNWSSEEMAASFRGWELSGQNHLTFVIGGDIGLSPAVLAHSDLCLSLSKMTFPHPLARLLLVEQIYRAFRIIRGEPYHK